METRQGLSSVATTSRAMPGGPRNGARPPVIALGTAPLPANVAESESGPLIVELALDPKEGRIIRVAATVTLTRYSELLCSLLVGCRLHEAEGAVCEVPADLLGGLSSPAIAALANALFNADSLAMAAITAKRQPAANGTDAVGPAGEGAAGVSWAV